MPLKLSVRGKWWVQDRISIPAFFYTKCLDICTRMNDESQLKLFIRASCYEVIYFWACWHLHLPLTNGIRREFVAKFQPHDDHLYFFRFRRGLTQEVQSLRLCQGHPNIVNIHEVYQDGVSCFFINLYCRRYIISELVTVKRFDLYGNFYMYVARFNPGAKWKDIIDNLDNIDN